MSRNIFEDLLEKYAVGENWKIHGPFLYVYV